MAGSKQAGVVRARLAASAVVLVAGLLTAFAATSDPASGTLESHSVQGGSQGWVFAPLLAFAIVASMGCLIGAVAAGAGPRAR